MQPSLHVVPGIVDDGERARIAITRIATGDNDRTFFDPVKLQALADSIAEVGLQQPVVVRRHGRGFELVAGERRLRAVRDILGRRHIEATIRDLTDEQASRIMLTENVHREDLDPMEEARGYAKRMRQFELTPGQVAEWAGVTVARVATRLPLMRLCPEAQHAVSRGTLAINVGGLLSKLDANRQVMALTAMNRDGLGYFEMHRLCERMFADQQAEAETPLLDDPMLMQRMTRQAVADARRMSRRDLLALIGDLADHAGTLPTHLRARVAAARK